MSVFKLEFEKLNLKLILFVNPSLALISSRILPAHLKIQILYRYWITISMEKQGFETLSGYDNFVYALKAK